MYTHVQMLMVRFHIHKTLKIKQIIINLPIKKLFIHKLPKDTILIIYIILNFSSLV